MIDVRVPVRFQVLCHILDTPECATGAATIGYRNFIYDEFHDKRVIDAVVRDATFQSIPEDMPDWCTEARFCLFTDRISVHDIFDHGRDFIRHRIFDTLTLFP